MALAVGCHGFFVDPILTGMSVSTLQSTTLVAVGNTVQLVATGTYDDGSHKNFSGSATWSVTPPGFVAVNAAGLATATKVTNPGTAITVQAAAQSSNGTVVSGSVTVTAGTSTALTITSSPTSPISIAAVGSGATVQFAASLNGNNVTGSTTFTSGNSNIINIRSGSTAGTLGTTTGTVTISGTDSADAASGSVQITVTN